MKNTVVANYEEKPTIITSGMLLYVTPSGYTPSNDDFYIVSACPNPDGVTPATLVLTNLSYGSVYNAHTLPAKFNFRKSVFEATIGKSVFEATIADFEKYIGTGVSWGLVKSVTIKRED